jgi:uncharacterized cupredoxin-like copper-binding protein
MALFLLSCGVYHLAMVKFTAKHVTSLLLASLLLTLFACSSGEPAEQSPDPRALTVVASDIAYNATQIEAKAGQPIQLTLDNQGVLEHDFTIVKIPLSGEITMSMSVGEMEEHDMSHMTDHPDLHVAAVSGSHNTIEFTPSAPGEYAFYCTVSGHREAGMEGSLVVK